MKKLLFPNLVGKWAGVNLNAAAQNFSGSLSNPEVQEELVNKLHQRLKVNYSYGGYMEHRNILLKDQYNASAGEDHFWHLGTDYNVPKDTPVSLPIDGELVYSNIDTDHDGGWGGKLIFKVGELYLILGHLYEIVTECRQYKKGEVVGKVANYPTNGNWFPHLHLQWCSKFDPLVDGYSHNYNGIESDYPDIEII